MVIDIMPNKEYWLDGRRVLVIFVNESLVKYKEFIKTKDGIKLSDEVNIISPKEFMRSAFNLTLEEQYSDDIIMKCRYTGRRIKKIINFEACGTFGAITKAEEYLKKRGYTVGSMCHNLPIGFAKGYKYIAKWRNIPPSEYYKLDGIIVSDDFREGGVQILFYEKSKGQKMLKKFEVIIYGLPSEEVKVDANKLQEIIMNELDYFVDVKEVRRD